MTYLLRDFVETDEGLIFALVAGGVENGRVLGFLRYVRYKDGAQKIATGEANDYLRVHYPKYLYYSESRDVWLHGVPLKNIHRHFQPRARLREVARSEPSDAVEADAKRLCERFVGEGFDLDHAGLTGSLLIGAQTLSSDIDLVIYGSERFQVARGIVRSLIAKGFVREPDEVLWWETYRRRGCSLGFGEYLWHEKRKLNKGAINGRKFDISPVAVDVAPDRRRFFKRGEIKLQATVADDREAFEYPARYRLDHDEISEVLSFTATYAGQATTGERVEVSGFLEQCEDGSKRIVVGSSREAPGEYIKVVSNQSQGGT